MSLTPFGSSSFDESLLFYLLENESEHGPLDNVQGSEISFQPPKGDFQVQIDVQHFRPEELKVRLVKDYLIIEGRHEERVDEHGIISRQFVRKYKIPENVDMTAFQSTLSSDGILTVHSTRKAITDGAESNRKEYSDIEITSVEGSSTVFH